MRFPFDMLIVGPVGTPPLEFIHVTGGMMDVFPHSIAVHISVNVLPATGLPKAVMLAEYTDTAWRWCMVCVHCASKRT